MNYTPKSIKRTFKKVVNELSLHPELFAKNPDKDFTRKRKLPFKEIVNTMFSMTGKTLCGELMQHFGMSNTMPTVSAFVQQRNKINSDAFEILFHRFTETIDEQKLYRGYRLLAIDGSDLRVPTNPDESISFHKRTNGQKSFNLLHLNALYDLQRKIYVDAIVQGSEHKSFVTMVDRGKSDIPSIYIADRGYESYNNMAHIQEKGAKFLIRIKDVTSNNGIAKGLHLPQNDEFDMEFRLELTRQQTKEALGQNSKFISYKSTFDYLPKKSSKGIPMGHYELFFRIVRIKISDDIYELLITNLDNKDFSSAELKELYAMRWGIETSFRTLKYTLGLIYFHSKKTEYILQEIFTSLTMYNFAQLITSHVVIKQKSRKYLYQVNFSPAVHICRNFLLKNISPSLAETLISQHISPIRPSASNPRKMYKKNTTSFIYRVA